LEHSLSISQSIVVEDVYSGIETGKKIIEGLGNKKYPFKVESKYFKLF